jgi:photosystem II stability/assembly factor-like uncharacterized protein
MTKRLQYIILIIAFQLPHINVYAQGTWESIESPTDQLLTSIYFVDSLYGWAVGDSGTIIHTTNGGTDWSFQNSKTENRITDVFFLNRNLGWAPSWNSSSFPFGTVILNTTDGGETWNAEPYREDNIFIQCILFLDSLTGWMGGKPHALVKTTDGGVDWQQAEIDSALFAFFPVVNINFYDSLYGFACGGAFEYAGVVWSTTNGGDNWQVMDPAFAAADPIQEIHVFDSLNVLGISGDFELFGVGVIRTSDGGAFWEYENLGMPGVGFDLDFRNESEAWCPLGGQQKFIYSLDSGVTWTQIPTPDSSLIFDVIFPDSLHGFAVGREGAILKYKPPIVDAVSDYHDVTPESFELYQNYPNPFNPTTKIKFTVPTSPLNPSPYQGEGNRERFITLIVYDVLGNEIATLVNEEKAAGIYEVEFSAKGGSASGGNAWSLPSGIYFYRLQTGTFAETKKMVLSK